MTTPERLPSTSEVRAVPYTELVDVWPTVSASLAAVFEPVGYTEGHVINELFQRHMQLWVADEFACITEISVLPRWKVCTVLFLAGHGVTRWFDDLMDVLEAWARENGCKYTACHGRPGWKKLGGARGYDVVATSLRKQL